MFGVVSLRHDKQVKRVGFPVLSNDAKFRMGIFRRHIKLRSDEKPTADRSGLLPCVEFTLLC